MSAVAELRSVHGSDRVPKVIFVNRYFFPDESATSQMLSDIAKQLAGRGLSIGVICSRQLYNDPSAILPEYESVEGISIYRVWTSRFGRHRLVGRAIDYISFYFSAAAKLWALARAGDTIVAKTDPPMLSIVAAPIARWRGARLINWLQDVFPEVATHLGQNPLPHWMDRVLRKVRDLSLRSAHHNVVLGQRMRDHLIGCGANAERISIIENWADGDAISPQPSEFTQLRKATQLEGKFVVGYSGNLGRAHEFETILAAAELLCNFDDIIFLMIGGGAGMEQLRSAVDQRQLNNFRFLAYQPRAALTDSLSTPDIHLACLLPSLEGLIVPSKVYGILAAGRPLIFIGDPHGEIARVVRDGECGAVVRTGDGAALAEQLMRFKREPQEAKAAGIRARLLFEQSYTLDAATQKWLTVLQSVSNPVSSAASA